MVEVVGSNPRPESKPRQLYKLSSVKRNEKSELSKNFSPLAYYGSTNHLGWNGLSILSYDTRSYLSGIGERSSH